MSLPAFLAFVLVLLLIEIHTFSYAVWNWKNGNRSGSVIVFLVCLAAAALPVYLTFFST